MCFYYYISMIRRFFYFSTLLATLLISSLPSSGHGQDRDRLSVSFNGIRVAKSGARDPSYDEAEVSAAMKQPKIQISSRGLRADPYNSARNMCR